MGSGHEHGENISSQLAMIRAHGFRLMPHLTRHPPHLTPLPKFESVYLDVTSANAFRP